MSAQLEIDKHWYNFRMFGELAYNNELGDDYWKKALKPRYPQVNEQFLFDAWETVSEVVPQLNRAAWAATDGDFAPEMCQDDSKSDCILRTANDTNNGEKRCAATTR